MNNQVPTSELPTQPLTLEDGKPRFKRNPLVWYLFHSSEISLEGLLALGHDVQYVQQFLQLLGYSVCGYSEMSFIPEEEKEKIEQMCFDWFGEGV